MSRSAIPILTLALLTLAGCGDDRCSDDNPCIVGYACTKDGKCEDTPTLAITTAYLPDGIVGEPYGCTMKAIGGIKDYRWSIETVLPWLSLDANLGVLQGTPPTSIQNATVKITVTDNSYGSGTRSTETYTIDVLNCDPRGSFPCSGHGACLANAECDCDTGYVGSQCASCADGYHVSGDECLPNKSCLPNSCSYHGTCDDSTGEIDCTCLEGYEGPLCEECATNYHHEGIDCFPDRTCSAGFCSGQGTCNDASGFPVCTCDNAYTGTHCHTCSPGHHEEDDACAEDQSCLETTCSGNGTCDDGAGSVSCTCEIGHDGDFCERCSYGYHREADECVPNVECPPLPCSGNGTCNDSSGLPVCECDPGYAGDDCDVCAPGFHEEGGACIPDDSCLASTCNNHGSCDDSNGAAQCTCEEGFAGSGCDECAPGFHAEGDSCTLNEYCQPDSCSFHGLCDDSANRIICTCNDEYTGDLCTSCSWLECGSNCCGETEYCSLAETCRTQTKIRPPHVGTGQGFGTSLASDGDLLVIGTPYFEGLEHAGNSYVFKRLGDSEWELSDSLLAPDGHPKDKFGYSVDVNDEYVIVGAVQHEVESAKTGAAYVFYSGDQISWDEGTSLGASDAQADSVYGVSVSIDGDYAVVGAPGDETSAIRGGAVYVYRRTGLNSWDNTKKLLSADGIENEAFGGSVHLDGDYLVVGSPGSDGIALATGATFVFRRTGDNEWNSVEKLVAPDGIEGDSFGASITTYGDRIAIGSWRRDEDKGAVYIFDRTGENDWEFHTLIAPQELMADDKFGYSVSLSNDYVIIGAPGTVHTGDWTGAAYLYRLNSESSWELSAKIYAFDAETNESFGASVSIMNYCVFMGAPQDDSMGPSSGAVYAY